MSTIAAIFSMNGDFAAGEGYWWIFWVASTAVLGMVSLVFFIESIMSLLHLISVPFIRRKHQGNEQENLDIKLRELDSWEESFDSHNSCSR